MSYTRKERKTILHGPLIDAVRVIRRTLYLGLYEAKILAEKMRSCGSVDICTRENEMARLRDENAELCGALLSLVYWYDNRSASFRRRAHPTLWGRASALLRKVRKA